jgi:F-type H+-transporting ATPase subunit delta
MNNGLISKRYAKALMDYAAQRGEDKVLYDRMQALLTATIAVPQLQERLQNPMVAPADKRALLYSAIGGGSADMDETTKKFADLLLRNGREGMLQSTAVCCTALYRKKHNIRTIRIKSYEPLSDKAVARVRSDVEKHLGGKAEVAAVVDESIGGGLVFQIDDMRFDGSVAGQLERIRRQFMRDNKVVR